MAYFDHFNNLAKPAYNLVRIKLDQNLVGLKVDFVTHTGTKEDQSRRGRMVQRVDENFSFGATACLCENAFVK